ncbi:NAD-dependent epimerase/dehydratase family protein [Microbacterium sp.]|uniref:NAD-dependent epimerase/dehydratase family protein n=1 Tax=Microbacterium sp. TaxID=51671 RepID=UPI003C74123C
MPNSTPLVLVFGGTGRIGPQIVEHIARDTEVVVFSRGDSHAVLTGHTSVTCELGDPAATRDAIHRAMDGAARDAAAPLGILYMATRGMGADDPRSLDDEIEIAVGGFASVVRAVAELTPTPRNVAVVFVSSLAVVTHPREAAGYVVGKAAGEQLCVHWAHNPPVEAWTFNVLRVGRVSRDPALGDAVAALAGFLVSEQSRAVSGQVFSACSPVSE